MKTKKDCYKSVNHPELFEFHDSVFELGYVDGKDIAVRVHGLNISKRTEQNPKGYDLEINIHPGRMTASEMDDEIPRESAETFYLSDNRCMEAQTVRAFHDRMREYYSKRREPDE